MKCKGQLMGEFRAFLRNLPSRLIGAMRCRMDQSDIAQEAVLQVLRQGTDVAELNPTYVKRLHRGHESKAIRYHTQECRSIAREENGSSEPEVIATPESVAADRERQAWVAREVQTLPDKQQLVIAEHCFKEKSFSTIADEFGETAKIWSGRYKKAIAELARRSGRIGDVG